MVVFFHDVNAIILMLSCELMGTIAGEDLAHLQEQNGIWLCHVYTPDLVQGVVMYIPLTWYMVVSFLYP